MKISPIYYLPAMFATCMLFQTLYLACVLLWVIFPGMAGHTALTVIFPQFKLLDIPSFFYGLLMSAFYGWFVAVVFVFFYNLWPRVASVVWGKSGSYKAT